ncbi:MULTISPECIES: GGDEF domain-containing protein [Clostridium]|uniref:GGDEF domain-containing protein n=1 Tax=Clostridium TaxID=1485 RepID=UPI00069FD1D7|nr:MULTISPECIES: diguanylate cyclase [Clostridium]KOF58041.1 hypothetical protein AGR56_01625 [Clostridium sp. DMHC 10]MCD2347154.1 diguanylate cyclase [Clostridium guangxiense]
MNRDLYNMLNNLNEGIIVLDENLKIYLWNKYMKVIAKIDDKRVIDSDIYKIMPNLNKGYFKKSMDNVLSDGGKMFFSAAMHKGLVNNKENLNLIMSSFEIAGAKFLLLEFIDVTNQFTQINMLKDYIKELYRVNMKLKKKENTIRKLAYYDKLTGVANRTLFYELAEKSLDNSKRQDSLLGLMFIDVDKFKDINDTYGHKVGDKVLVNVAKILKEATRKNDIVARYGGDEFLILLPNMKNTDDYNIVISRIINSKSKSINFNGKEINISLSIGVSFYPHSGDSIDKLIVEADKAMYAAKKMEGKDCSVYKL